MSHWASLATARWIYLWNYCRNIVHMECILLYSSGNKITTTIPTATATATTAAAAATTTTTTTTLFYFTLLYFTFFATTTFYMLLAGLFLYSDKTLRMPLTFSIIQNTTDCILPMYIIYILISLIFQFRRDQLYSISHKICSRCVVIFRLVYIVVLMGFVCFICPYYSGLLYWRCYDCYGAVEFILKSMD